MEKHTGLSFGVGAHVGWCVRDANIVLYVLEHSSW